MVWNEGLLPYQDGLETIFPNLSIVTSPFTTTAAGLVPHVLRSDIVAASFGSEPWITNCGYAIRYSERKPTPGAYDAGVFVVRLSDGQAWVLPSNTAGPSVPLGWQKPLAVTCDEVFGLVSARQDGGPWSLNVARVRLDALGPGIPPN
jgi:hypothetical protein